MLRIFLPAQSDKNGSSANGQIILPSILNGDEFELRNTQQPYGGNMLNNEIEFESMKEQDSNAVVNLIAKSMNDNEGKWAQKTIAFHYFCKNNNIDDGRRYIIARHNGEVVGITGLHNYNWGPEDVTWLGWFAVSPHLQGMKLGYRLMQQTVMAAKQMGYRKLFVETYSDEGFAKARAFYLKYGFSEVGHINGYINNNTNMVVFGMDIT